MPTLTTISEAYRGEQERLNAAAADRLAAVFPSLNLRNLDASSVGWSLAVASVVTDMHRESAELAADVYSDYRRESGVTGRVSFIFRDPELDKLSATLTLVGPHEGKKMLAAGFDFGHVAARLFADTTASALRHGQAGGRDLMRDTARADKKATQFVRVTGAKPCGWCAMKALMIYKSEDTARGGFHDNDQCRVLPRFDVDGLPDGYDTQMQLFERIYSDARVYRPNARGIDVVAAKPTVRNMNRLMRQVNAGTWDEFA